MSADNPTAAEGTLEAAEAASMDAFTRVEQARKRLAEALDDQRRAYAAEYAARLAVDRERLAAERIAAERLAVSHRLADGSL